MNNSSNIDDFITAKIKEHYSCKPSDEFSENLQKRLLEKLKFQKEEKKTGVFAGIILSGIISITILLAVVLVLSHPTDEMAKSIPILNQLYFIFAKITYYSANILLLGESTFLYYFLLTVIGIVFFFILEKISFSLHFRRTN
jgi:hypothetical protein